MISTSRQLKARIQNMAKGSSGKSQLLLRIYGMERFLERLSLSDYRDYLILKGGILVVSMIGVDYRATMDLDTTIKSFTLNRETAQKVISDIISVKLDDSFSFTIKELSTILEDADYQGVRVRIDAQIEQTRIPFSVDISTGDIITPNEISYDYKMMFEERTISLLSYNLETVLAEKIETVLSRSVFNTRLRDYYDLYVLRNIGKDIDFELLSSALISTCKNRGSVEQLSKYRTILEHIKANQFMYNLWKTYQSKNDYAIHIEWDEVVETIFALCAQCIGR